MTKIKQPVLTGYVKTAGPSGGASRELTEEENHPPERIFSMGKHSCSGNEQVSVLSLQAFQDGAAGLLGSSVAVACGKSLRTA